MEQTHHAVRMGPADLYWVHDMTKTVYLAGQTAVQRAQCKAHERGNAAPRTIEQKFDDMPSKVMLA